jgi:hypothetical protein
MKHSREFTNDIENRACEIIRDLDRDGYPGDIKVVIATEAVARLIACSEDADELKAIVATVQRAIDERSRMWFDIRSRG